jgi:hypothetical protein
MSATQAGAPRARLTPSLLPEENNLVYAHMLNTSFCTGQPRMAEFRKKLCSLARLDPQISELWYKVGARVKREYPTAPSAELVPLVVKAVWEDAQKDDNLFQQVGFP